VFEAQFFEDREGFCTASPTLAMHEIRLLFIQLGHVLGKGGVHEIDVLGVGDVAFGKFFGGAHIQDRGLVLGGEQFGGGGWVNVFDGGGGFGVCGEGHEETDKNEGEYFHVWRIGGEAQSARDRAKFFLLKVP
jgi:hypothetical protein